MAKKQKKAQAETYGIIGLGRFGFALAQTLAQAGREIIVIDRSEEKINAAAAFTDNAFIVETLSRENLQQVGIQNCDTVIVGIGEKIDTSILTVLTVVQLGVKRVIAKAISAEHGSVLQMLGAEVVYPERDMAVRTANKLLAPRVLEYISLSDKIDITEIELTAKIDRMTVAQLDLRKRFGLNIVAVKQQEELSTEIVPELPLNDGDVLTVVGKRDNIHRFEEYLH